MTDGRTAFQYPPGLLVRKKPSIYQDLLMCQAYCFSMTYSPHNHSMRHI